MKRNTALINGINKSIHIRVDYNMIKILRDILEKRKMTINEFVNDAIKKEIEAESGGN